MKIETQRIIDRYLGIVICRIFSIFYRFQKKANPTEIKNILIILLSEMGALVLAHPMVEYLREKYPDASLHVMLFEKNREVMELLGTISANHILTISDKSLPAFIRDAAVAWSKMRKTNFDAVIDCELFSRVSSIFSFLSGATIRVGFHPHTQEGLYRGNFMTKPVLYNPYHHVSRQFLTLVDAMDSTTQPKAKRQVTTTKLKIPAIEFEKQDIDRARKRLVDGNPGIAGRKIVLIYPGGGLLPIRAWPLDYYCRLTEKLLHRGFAVCIIGLAEDKELAGKILSHTSNPNCVDLTGYTKTIRELMIIFHFSSLLITNDGGPGHFAALTPIPAIVFFGPETPTLYSSLDENAVNFYLDLSCSPCVTAYNHRNSPCDGNNLCLKQIEPDEVLNKAIEILEAPKVQNQRPPSELGI